MKAAPFQLIEGHAPSPELGRGASYRDCDY
jgi:hypothetical protein